MASTALTKTKKQLASARSSYASYRRKVRDAQIPEALMGSGAVLVGAAAGGFIDETVDLDLLGLDTSVLLALVSMGIGIGMNNSTPIYLAAGMVSNLVREQAAAIARGEPAPIIQDLQSAVG